MAPEVLGIDYSLEEIQYTPATENIGKALEYARFLHSGQFRKTGEPYVNHVVEVAQILEQWGLNATHNEDIIIAAILHDSIEDCEANPKQIEAKFGERVRQIVEALTKVKPEDNLAHEIETLRKIAKSVETIPEVLLIKLADRLHNMRTLDPFSEDKKKTKAQETMRAYVTLARDLGMWDAMNKLRDLSFQYMDEKAYNQIKNIVDNDPRRDFDYLARMEEEILAHLSVNHIYARIEIRFNGIYAIYEKFMKGLEEGKSPERGIVDITDVVSVRVITEKVEEMMLADYYIQKLYEGKLDPDRYDRFILQNVRPNGYSAIHNTVVNEDLGAIEIALVTEEMEEVNRRGVLVDFCKDETINPLYKLKCVIGYNGALMLMPIGFTGIDIAYRLGHCEYAASLVVNGKRLTLSYMPKSGDVIEVVLNHQAKAPDTDWLNHCSRETAQKIKSQLDSNERRLLVFNGQRIAREWLKEYGVISFEDIPENYLSAILDQFSITTTEELYRKIGLNKYSQNAVQIIFEKLKISKEALGLTTIYLSGSKDGPGILLYYIEYITLSGGNIESSRNNPSGSGFEIKIVASGLNPYFETQLQEMIKEDPDLDSECFVI